jgi:small subunit ribosomal protein S8
MSKTDPISDLLTRIRNANLIKLAQVECPSSRTKVGVVETLKRSGFIRDFRVIEDGRQGTIRIYLKYGPDGEKIINEINRVSTPGRRVYVGSTELPRPLDGMGVAIVSTNKGVLSDGEARSQHLGGEVLCEVW